MAGLQPHPSYPNPTVAQVACYLEFDRVPDSDWTISKPKPVFDALAEFPVVEPFNMVQTMFQAAPGAPALGVGLQPQSIQQYKLNNDDRTAYAVISEKSFMFGYSGKYPGWPKFCGHFLQTWEKFATVAKPATITKSSLRYVNVIPRDTEHRLVSDWIAATDTIPKTVVDAKRDPFLARVESWIDEDHLIMVTLGLVGAQNALSSIFFDLDRQCTSKFDAKSRETIEGCFKALHEDVWKEFEAARTPTLEAFLKRVPA